MGRLRTIWKFLSQYKYIITVALLVLIIGVWDDNSLLKRYRRIKNIEQLKKEINLYRDQFNKADKTLKELDTNPKALEKTAREKYYMHRENEDVFVIMSPVDQESVTDTQSDSLQYSKEDTP